MKAKSNWEQSGFVKKESDLKNTLLHLEENIEQVAELFSTLSQDAILERPAPGKWSKKEILGHLIDSAINNLKRFTEIQFSPQPYVVISYRQDELVQVNHYHDLPLPHLMGLWQHLNRQIVFVARKIPADKLNYQVDPKYDDKTLRTLAWIIRDYVAHMDHHLEQLR